MAQQMKMENWPRKKDKIDLDGEISLLNLK